MQLYPNGYKMVIETNGGYMSKQPKVSSLTKLKVYMRDAFTCTYCDKHVVDAEELTVDHVVPKSQGGSNHMRNLATACEPCNKEKRDLLLTQYLRAFEIKITKRIMRFL